MKSLKDALPFPEFRNIEYSDRESIEEFVRHYTPVADYNFINLWSWNVDDKQKYCELNGNLVVQFTDYITGEVSISFIGVNKINETARTLVLYAREQGLNEGLSYATEDIANALSRDSFEIVPDEDNFDYVYSTRSLAGFLGSEYKTKRSLARRVDQLGSSLQIVAADLSDIKIQRQIDDLFDLWAENRSEKSDAADHARELIAIRRVVHAYPHGDNFYLTCAFINGALVGFGIEEKVRDDMALSHFVKVDTSIPGLSERFNQYIANRLLEDGILYWNWEQDLGIEGLRRLKQSYRPAYQIRKYFIRLLASADEVTNRDSTPCKTYPLQESLVLVGKS